MKEFKITSYFYRGYKVVLFGYLNKGNKIGVDIAYEDNPELFLAGDLEHTNRNKAKQWAEKYIDKHIESIVPLESFPF